MKKLLIILVIISVIMVLLGDYINSLLVSIVGTLPTIMQPFSMFITFYSYVFDVIFSNYYVSLFINIIIVFFVFGFLINFLAGIPTTVKEFSETRKQKQRLKEQERKSKAAAYARYQSSKASFERDHRGDYTETIRSRKVKK